MNPQVLQVLGEMGVIPQDIQAIQRAPSFQEAQRLLEVLKEKVSKGFKKIAFDCHPDRAAARNDPPEVVAQKTAKFNIANQIKIDVENLKVSPSQPRPPIPPPVPFVPVHVVFVTHYYPANTTTGTATAYARVRQQNPWAATTMHPNGVGGTRVR